MKYSKEQFYKMARKIHGVNRALWESIYLCEELSKDSELYSLYKELEVNEEPSEEWKTLKEYVRRVNGKFDDAADARLHGADLDDATDMLKAIFNND